MSRVCLFLLLGMTFCAVTVQAANLGEIKPLPIPENALTWKRYWQEQYEWQRETLKQQYAEFGKRSDAWDSDMPALFDNFARHKALSGMPDRNDLRSFIANLKLVVDKGCDDPMLLSMYGMALSKGGRHASAIGYLKRSVQALEASGYSLIYKFRALWALDYSYKRTGKRDLSSEMKRQKFIYLAKAAADQHFKGKHLRDYMWVINGAWNNARAEDLDHLFDAFHKTSGIDPWLHHMIKYKYHYRNYQRARARNGKTRKVIKKEELSLARKELIAAHKLRPEFPEAASSMVRVAGIMPSICEKPLRWWFDQGIQAQCDYEHLYENMLSFMKPQQGESLRDKKLKFGLECLYTQRFDTDIPLYFDKVVWNLAKRSSDWREAYRYSGCYENFEFFYKGMLAEPRRADEVGVWKSRHAMVAYAAKRYEASRALFGDIAGREAWDTYARFETYADIVRSELALYQKPYFEKVDQAEKLFAAGQYAKAVPLYKDIQAHLASSSKGHYLLEKRLAFISDKQELSTGRWIDILPVAATHFAGWTRWNGTWTIGGGGELQTTHKNGHPWTILTYDQKMDGDFEIRGISESACHTGIILGHRGKTGYKDKFLRIGFFNKKDLIIVSEKSCSIHKRTRQMEVGREVSFLVSVRGNRVSVSVDGKEVLIDEKIPSFWWKRRGGFVGLGAHISHCKHDSKVYRDVQLRLLGVGPQDGVEKVPLQVAEKPQQIKMLELIQRSFRRHDIAAGPNGIAPLYYIFNDDWEPIKGVPKVVAESDPTGVLLFGYKAKPHGGYSYTIAKGEMVNGTTRDYELSDEPQELMSFNGALQLQKFKSRAALLALPSDSSQPAYLLYGANVYEGRDIKDPLYISAKPEQQGWKLLPFTE